VRDRALKSVSLAILSKTTCITGSKSRAKGETAKETKPSAMQASRAKILTSLLRKGGFAFAEGVHSALQSRTLITLQLQQMT
jgi:hypothetical protein